MTTTKTDAGMASTEGIFARLDPAKIHRSPFQHRTIFDPAEMEELQKDAARNGIHTALIVRPHPSLQGDYELATGERRLRTAKELGLADVPALIRALSDREVRELQWSENFRRVNPNPLDEAGSLEQMLEYHKTVDGLARYIGKPKAYVLLRLRLLDLIPFIREMVHAGVFNLKDSLELATLAQDDQMSFFVECCKDWKNRKTFRIHNLSASLTRYRRDLSRAIFDPKDKDLVPETGACTHCPYNSATYRSLFPETEKTSICNRQVCFENKCEAHLRRHLTRLLADYQPTAIVSDEPVGKMWQSVLNEFPAIAGLPRFLYYDLYSVEAPAEPDRSDYGYDENDKEDEGGFDEEGYAEALTEYRAEKEEYEQALRDGKFHRGLYLEAESVSWILFDPDRPHSPATDATTTAAAVQQAIKAGTATRELIEGEMTRIRQRQKRNIELDREKVQNTVHDRFTEKLAGKEPLPTLTDQDQVGTRLLIYQALDYSAKADFHRLVPRKEKSQQKDGLPLTQWLALLTDAEFVFMIRLAIRCHKDAKSPTTDTGNALWLMAGGIDVDVDGIQASQDKIAEIRNARAEERLANLDKRLNSLDAKQVAPEQATVAN